MTQGDPARQLERLPGVVAATLFLDTPSAPRVYVATDGDADHETLRAAVIGLLRDHGYGTGADQVHIGTVPPARPAAAIFPAVSLDAVEVHRAENRIECTVRLRLAGRYLTATAVEPDTASGRARAAARAAIAAAEGLDPDYRFGLEGVRTLDLLGEPAVIVLVDASAGRSSARVPGAALLDPSVEEAAALAALRSLRSWVG